MKTKRLWIYGGLMAFTLVVGVWVHNAKSASDRLDEDQRHAFAAEERRETEFKAMDSEQQKEHLRKLRLDSMRRNVTEARTPGEIAAAQAEYEAELRR
jgi:hypothetical protein